ncbi:MAG: DUF4350 domain-containing protein [Proteobacteria bacterium]|nr:DUF4350 domain-containing protein [Pseudomonadota bacterium]
MRERLLSFGLALAALALFWVLVFPKPRVDRGPESQPLSTDPGPDGYLGLSRWLAAEHIAAQPWRRGYDRLAAPDGAPGTGNVLITTLPHVNPARLREIDVLNTWVERGNVLFIVAALDDTPRWAQVNGAAMIDELRRLAGLDFKTERELAAARARAAAKAAAGSADARPAAGDEEDDDAAAPATAPGRPDSAGGDRARRGPLGAAIAAGLAPSDVALAPVAPHPLLASVRELATHSELPADRWLASSLDDSPLLELARRADTGQAALWLKARGRGRLLICAYASPFGNALLDRAGNARLIANLVGGALGPAGRVLLDDGHLGASDEYDPRAFYRDPRLHRTLLWIVVVWLLITVGAQALRPATSRATRRDDTAWLATAAAFLANAVPGVAVGRRLLEQFFNGLHRRLGLPEDGTPAWPWLEAHPRLAAADVAQLRLAHARLAAGRRVDLTKLNRLLMELTRRLQ